MWVPLNHNAGGRPFSSSIGILDVGSMSCVTRNGKRHNNGTRNKVGAASEHSKVCVCSRDQTDTVRIQAQTATISHNQPQSATSSHNHPSSTINQPQSATASRKVHSQPQSSTTVSHSQSELSRRQLQSATISHNPPQ